MTYPCLLKSRTHNIKVIAVSPNTCIVVKSPAEYTPDVGTILESSYNFIEDDTETVKDYMHIIKQLDNEAKKLSKAISLLMKDDI